MVEMTVWQEKTVAVMLADSVSRWGGRTALITEDGDRYTYQELYDEVSTLALGLHAMGISPGDHVATIMGGRATYVLTSYALMMIGAVVVPVNYTFQADETAFVLNQSDSRYVIMEDAIGAVNVMDLMKKIAPEMDGQDAGSMKLSKLPHLKSVIVGSASRKRYAGTLDFDDIVRRGREQDKSLVPRFIAERKKDDPAFIMFTSGTTAFPKGAVRSQGSAVGIAYYITVRASNLTEQDVAISASPFFHIGGCIYNLMGPHLCGAALVLMSAFDPGKSLEFISRYHVTYMSGFDTHFHRLTKHPAFAATDLSSLKKIRLATGPDWYDRVREAGLGKEVVSHHYGFTEGTGVIMPYEETDYETRKNANGKPFPGVELKIVDPETGKRQQAGAPGEICLRGWTLFHGYYNMPDQTAAAMDDEGFFHTGDYGWLDERGYLYYRGRYKQMIKTGGENVSQKEVENFLEGHPDIQSVQVIGLPDVEWGEAVTAVVQTISGRELTPEDVKAFCKGKISGYKIPKRVLTIQESEWPVSKVGKIEKMKLRAWAMEKAGIQAGA